MDVLYRANVTDGLFLNEWSMDDGKPMGSKFIHALNHSKPHLFFIEHVTIGATSDSGYEYLLKQWVQSGDPKARQQCTLSKRFHCYPRLVLNINN
jgi:mannosyl-oligosaccharide alpha-1,2-mannosidase